MAPDRVAPLATQLTRRCLFYRYHDPIHWFFGQFQILLTPSLRLNRPVHISSGTQSVNSDFETGIGLKAELSVNPKTSVTS